MNSTEECIEPVVC